MISPNNKEHIVLLDKEAESNTAVGTGNRAANLRAAGSILDNTQTRSHSLQVYFSIIFMVNKKKENYGFRDRFK